MTTTERRDWPEKRLHVPPVPTAPPVDQVDEPAESDPDVLGALGAWAALGFSALYLATVIVRYLWRVIFG